MKASDLLMGVRNRLKAMKIPFYINHGIIYCPAVDFEYHGIKVSVYYNSQHQDKGLICTYVTPSGVFKTFSAMHHSYLFTELERALRAKE